MKLNDLPPQPPRLPAVTVDSSSHMSPRSGHCLMEIVSFIRGEEFGDHPDIGAGLAAFCIVVNDRLQDGARQRLLPFALRLATSREPEGEAGAHIREARGLALLRFAARCTGRAMRAEGLGASALFTSNPLRERSDLHRALRELAVEFVPSTAGHPWAGFAALELASCFTHFFEQRWESLARQVAAVFAGGAAEQAAEAADALATLDELLRLHEEPPAASLWAGLQLLACIYCRRIERLAARYQECEPPSGAKLRAAFEMALGKRRAKAYFDEHFPQCPAPIRQQDQEEALA